MTWEMFRGMIKCTRRPEILEGRKQVHVTAIDIVGYERHLFYTFEDIEKYIDRIGDEQNEEIRQPKQRNQEDGIEEVTGEELFQETESHIEDRETEERIRWKENILETFLKDSYD